VDSLDTSARWHIFLRRRDFEQIVGSNPEVISGPLLEIGAGAGVVTEQLRELAGDVTPTDIRPRADIDGFVYADVQDLPFSDSQFRCVYSSNVLEHVPDLGAAIGELKRVLMDDGVMIHSMPTVSWKLVQLVLHPLGSAKAVIANRRGSSSGDAANDSDGVQRSTKQSDRGFGRRLIDLVVAPIHGVGSSHIDEIMRFSKRRWIAEFERAGLVVISSENLYFHSPYRLFPFRFMRIRSVISRIGLASVRSYRVVAENHAGVKIESGIQPER
jgi:SAM-dependent methyltransferase